MNFTILNFELRACLGKNISNDILLLKTTYLRNLIKTFFLAAPLHHSSQSEQIFFE